MKYTLLTSSLMIACMTCSPTMAVTATTPATVASTPNTVPAATPAPAKNSTLPPSSNITTSDPALRNSLNSLQDSKTPEYVILQPIDEATFSSETSASVEKILVKEGSYFQAGDILLELDCRVQKAEYQKAIAQQTATSIALKSAQRLKSYDSISEYEVVKARSDAAMVDADVSKLGAIVDKCIIKAPFNGAVAQLKVHTHDSVKPGDPLMKIVNTDHIIVEMEVPSEWLQWLHINSAFYVHVNEINKSISAKIIRINPQIEPVSQTVKVVGEVANTDDKLLPGMSGQASFPHDPAKNQATTTNIKSTP